MTGLVDWVAQARPRQWTKNLALYAPLLFAKALFVPGAFFRATLAVLAFCALASGVYVVNDWIDQEADRRHPIKQRRPIAAGKIGPGVAAAMTATLWLVGAGLAAALGRGFGEWAAAYVALQLVYTFLLKRMVVLDVVVIALGFVIRVAGGGAAIGVPVSNWLYLCAYLLALFLGFAKRRQELSSLEEASAHRSTLSEYSIGLLDQMLAVVAASCIVGFALYSVAPETIAHVGSDRMKLTVPCVVYGIFRYLFLVHRRGAGGSPERVLLSDPPLLANLLVFVALACWALYF